MLDRKDVFRVCVCGGRDYSDINLVNSALDYIKNNITNDKTLIIIQGCARGADALAADWTIRNNVQCEAYPAEWKKYGKSAGYVRNKIMLDTGLDLLVAFPGGKGTDMMKKLASKANVKVWEPCENAEIFL